MSSGGRSNTQSVLDWVMKVDAVLHDLLAHFKEAAETPDPRLDELRLASLIERIGRLVN